MTVSLLQLQVGVLSSFLRSFTSLFS